MIDSSSIKKNTKYIKNCNHSIEPNKEENNESSEEKFDEFIDYIHKMGIDIDLNDEELVELIRTSDNDK